MSVSPSTRGEFGTNARVALWSVHEGPGEDVVRTAFEFGDPLIFSGLINSPVGR